VIAAPVAAGVLSPVLLISSAYGGLTVSGTMTVGDGGAGLLQGIIAQRLSLLSPGTVLIDGGGLTGAVAWGGIDSTIGGVFTLPAARVHVDRAVFIGAVTCNEIQGSELDIRLDVTVTAVSAGTITTSEIGIAGGITWTGPAGTAQFDRHTAESFRQPSSNAFAGGSGTDDFVNPDEVVVSTFFFTLTASGTDTVNMVVPENRSVTRVTALFGGFGSLPSGAASDLDVKLSGTTSVLTAPVDLTSLTLGVLHVATVTSPPGQGVEAEQLEIEVTSGAIAGGSLLGVTVHMRVDTRALT
jgi:hypothetical protein